MTLSKLLVANRGEIAVRIIRAATDMGISTVSIYPSDDANSLHAHKADEAIKLDGRGVASYLDIAQIVAAAKSSGCDSIHPGYGFLAENAEFAKACREAGLIFVGPEVETLELFGDKLRAKAIAVENELPVLPGSGELGSADEASAFLDSLGDDSTMILKAVAGGGGRGARAVSDVSELKSLYAEATAEAMNAFGDGTLFAERLITRARHIEVQIMGDGTGAVSSFGERECSVQRRYQKVMEVAPAPNFPDGLRQRIIDSAQRLAAAVNYRSLGTFEFLVDASDLTDDSDFYFIETNARLQVEHTVTEAVTGIDLLETQLNVAAGSSLSELGLEQADIPTPRGFAIQARVNLETVTPDGRTLPSVGTLTAFDPPSGPGIRTDTFGYAGYTTSPSFDSLIAKVIGHSRSSNFKDAIRRTYRALSEFRIEGVATNLNFLQNMLHHPDFAEMKIHTRFVDEQIQTLARSENGSHPKRFAETAEAASVMTAPAITDTEAPEGTVGVTSPTQGIVAELHVAEGSPVRKGDQIAIVEAMKMFHTVQAELSGIVRLLAVTEGDTVFEGQSVAFVEEMDEADLGERPTPDAGSNRVAETRQIGWDAELDELALRTSLAHKMGGEDNVAFHKGRGKLTVRERIDALVDQDSFEEIGTLAGSATYDADGNLTGFTPANTVIGVSRVNGRRVMVNGGDFTIRGGASDANVGNKTAYSERMAIEWRLPFIRLLDAAGGSVRTFEQIGHTYLPNGPGHDVSPHLLPVVPSVAAVLGSVAGLPAVQAAQAHFSVMVKDTSVLFAGGPPVVKVAFGIDITKEDLGDADVQVRQSGVVNNLAESEEEAFDMIRQFLSYLPDSVYDMPPHVPPDDDRDRRDESLKNIIPRDNRTVFDPRPLLEAILDRDSIFEIAPEFGTGRITVLARVNGYPVGVMINDSRFDGGATGTKEAEKAIRFVELCETFHLPIINFADDPGFMIGREAESAGMLRLGARLHAVMASTETPWATIIIRQIFGVAGSCHVRLSGMHRRYSWPSGNWGSMHIEGGVDAAYRREIAAADDSDAKREEIQNRLKQLASPFRTAQTFLVEEIIDPRDSRPLLCDFVESAQAVIRTQLGPGSAPRFRP
jgi:acetyl/propionyl-CoA carboxylase alpha subunit/acetyl-CoA carboxylase carboxyltransferase component